jgi:hypothetical protein
LRLDWTNDWSAAAAIPGITDVIAGNIYHKVNAGANFKAHDFSMADFATIVRYQGSWWEYWGNYGAATGGLTSTNWSFAKKYTAALNGYADPFSSTETVKSVYLKLMLSGQRMSEFDSFSAGFKNGWKVNPFGGIISVSFDPPHVKHFVDYMYRKFVENKTELTVPQYRWCVTFANREITVTDTTRTKESSEDTGSSKVSLKNGTAEQKTGDMIDYVVECNGVSEKGIHNSNATTGLLIVDYFEWLNLYKYDDKYKKERGEEDGSDRWLTLHSFMVWKRMEKYDNYSLVPSYKRKISTTVLPSQQNSQLQPGYFSGSGASGDVMATDIKARSAASYFGWSSTIGFAFRPYNERYEYNETSGVVYWTNNRWTGGLAGFPTISNQIRYYLGVPYYSEKYTYYTAVLDEWGQVDFFGDYNRLYITYETFSKAAQQVFAHWDGTDGAYDRFMAYWAKSAGDSSNLPYEVVTSTSKYFWQNSYWATA